MTRWAARHGSRRVGLVSGATADDWLGRAVALAEAGRSAEARKATLRALKADPGNTTARHIAGLLVKKLNFQKFTYKLTSDACKIIGVDLEKLSLNLLQ